MGRWTGDDRTGDDDRPEWERMWTGLRDGEFLGPEDGVRKRGLVSINRGWLARGGLMRLYADRLEFEPNPLERLMLARRWSLPFRDIERLERRPERPDEVSPIGQIPRIRLHTAAAPDRRPPRGRDPRRLAGRDPPALGLVSTVGRGGGGGLSPRTSVISRSPRVTRPEAREPRRRARSPACA